MSIDTGPRPAPFVDDDAGEVVPLGRPSPPPASRRALAATPVPRGPRRSSRPAPLIAAPLLGAVVLALIVILGSIGSRPRVVPLRAASAAGVDQAAASIDARLSVLSQRLARAAKQRRAARHAAARRAAIARHRRALRAHAEAAARAKAQAAARARARRATAPAPLQPFGPVAPRRRRPAPAPEFAF